MTGAVTVAVSLKTYFGHAQAIQWFREVADRTRHHPAVCAGDIDVLIFPTYLQLLPALAAFEGTAVKVGAQDVSPFEPGPFTGEVSAVELVEVGVVAAEVGHAERRRLFHESEADTAAKVASSIRVGLRPLICVGEREQIDPEEAAGVVVEQMAACLDGAGTGPILVAYEPVWAIGAAHPAPRRHIEAVTRGLREALSGDPARVGSSVVYGGSAGPGLLTELADAVDGVFLGRFAHDPEALSAILDEAAETAATRRNSEATIA